MPSVGGRPSGIHQSRNKPDDVVDADTARVPQHGVDQRPERFVALLDELVGSPGRLRPVLAELVELVRGRARGDAEREHILQRPCVGAVRVHPDGEVVHDAELHARPDGRRLRRGQLVIELPLQPAVKIDDVGVLFGEGGDPRAGRVRERVGPFVPVGPVLLGQRTPDGEVVKAAALSIPVRRVRQLPPGGTRRGVHAFQRGALDLPCHVTVDELGAQCSVAKLDPRLADAAAMTHVGELGDRLHAQIEGVHVTSRRRQVWRRLHRCGRGRGV